MKNIQTLITSIFVFAVVMANAQTTPSTNATTTTDQKVSWASQFLKDWFKDNTNFFGQRSVIVGAGGLYSYGKFTESEGNKKSTYGAALSVMFPIDEKGQVSIGFYGARFSDQYFAGSIAATLGKTIHIPGINQDLFAWVESGPAINLNHPDQLLVQGFTGVTWKHDIVKGTEKREPFTLYLTGGYGRCTGWDGSAQIVGIGLGHKF